MIYENDKQKYILARNLGVNSATQTKCINACQLRVNKRIEPQSAKTSVSLECHHPYVIRKHEVKSSFL